MPSLLEGLKCINIWSHTPMLSTSDYPFGKAWLGIYGTELYLGSILCHRLCHRAVQAIGDGRL